MTTDSNSNKIIEEQDLSIAIGSIVTNALQLTKNLFCPYCANAYMFEFTLKDHLKKSHRNIIEKYLLQHDDPDLLSISQQCLHNCTFCGAAFTHLGLIPKHISTYHGMDLLKIWQQQNGNQERLNIARTEEPSILYAACSPGLSEIFNKMDTNFDNDSVGGDGCAGLCSNEQTINTNNIIISPTPQLKSILKKTPSIKPKIICSPSSAAATIRRTKSEIVKRSLSVRRELRFDPSTKRSPVLNLSNELITKKKTKKSFKFRNPFSSCNNNNNNTNTENNNRGKFSGRATSAAVTVGSEKLITSTPINFIDDDDDIDQINRKNWKLTIRNKHRPLFFDMERYQCALCKKSWENNAELLCHLRETHRGIKNWLRPQYRCNLCGATFFSNNFLIRHCHLQHTPAKKRIN